MFRLSLVVVFVHEREFRFQFQSTAFHWHSMCVRVFFFLYPFVALAAIQICHYHLPHGCGVIDIAICFFVFKFLSAILTSIFYFLKNV